MVWPHITDFSPSGCSSIHFVESLSPIYFYRPPPKLRECNAFSRVCLSVILSTGGPMWPSPLMHWSSPYSDHMGPHCTRTPASDIWWPRLKTCSNCSPEDSLFWLILTSSCAALPVVRITVCSRYCDFERHGELRPACVIFCIVQVTLETAVCPIMAFFEWNINVLRICFSLAVHFVLPWNISRW